MAELYKVSQSKQYLWETLKDRSYISQLNKNADEYTTYKVFYIARHGEGYHNQV